MKIFLGRYILDLTFFPTLIFLCLLTSLISLGLWQLGRAEEKRELKDLKNGRANDQAILFSANSFDNPDKFRYRKVVLAGNYDNDHQFLIDNQIANGKPGYFVMTPLKLSGSNKAVLINRGWVPLNMDRSILPGISLLNTENITVNGRINKFPGVGLKLEGAEIPTQGWPAVVQVIDRQIMSERLSYPLFDFQVELDPKIGEGFYRQWQKVKLLSPEKHIAYAFQWFALALTLCGIFFWYSWKRDQ